MKQTNQVLGAALIVLGFAAFDASAQVRPDADLQDLGTTMPDARAGLPDGKFKLVSELGL